MYLCRHKHMVEGCGNCLMLPTFGWLGAAQRHLQLNCRTKRSLTFADFFPNWKFSRRFLTSRANAEEDLFRGGMRPLVYCTSLLAR